jgi:hypothetical protein
VTAAPPPTGADRPAPEPPPVGGDERPIRDPLPPDPAAYDAPRARQARAKGLDAPYIGGGRDPEPEAGRREERFYGRLLVIMVVTIVLAGFVLGIVAELVRRAA